MCNNFIVFVDTEYINEKDGIIINDTIESVNSINRIGTVIYSPDKKIKAGYKILFHHNIVRMKNDIKKKQIKSQFWLEGNKYFVPKQEVFMYYDIKWNAYGENCFIKPIKVENTKIIDERYKGRLNHIGEIAYINEELLSYGLKQGDRVIFSRYSEYEFDIDGNIYYKMRTKDILGKC